ncbi:MAG: hypothetical protein H7A33_05990 [Deltaproteobacteria bacterium]|nr:hypothetical protein [Deltaproteobacteria bacterium]
MTMIKQLFSIFAALFFLTSIACDNNVSQVSVDADVNPEELTITIGQIYDLDSGSFVAIPLGVFGTTTDDLNGATINIYFNGALVDQLDASAFFYSTGDVRFYLTPVTDGDVLGFGITRADGGTLYYEGTASADEDSLASIAVADFDIVTVPEETPIQDYFESVVSETGSATGSTYSGVYSVTMGSMTFGDECDATFVNQTDFFVGSDLDTSEIADILENGSEQVALTVTVTQSNGSIIFDFDDDSEFNMSGSIDDDGTFTLFAYKYTDETNYQYQMLEGSFTTSDSTSIFNATMTAKITLDGETITNAYAGDCSMAVNMLGE